MASVPPDGYRRSRFDSLPSTNAAALAAARDGEGGGLWVTAAEQTEGRGRRGRGWATDRGNLAASLMLIDPAPAEIAPTLSFVAGVALHQAVVDVAGPTIAERLALKWPNDLLLDGFKVAGILIEGERLVGGGLAVAVGIGVNCVAHPQVSNHPASDFRARGVPLAAEALFRALARRMADETVAWGSGAGFAATRRAWLARAMGIGAPIRVDLGERVVEGRFETIDEAGRLVVDGGDGTREAVSAGDVFLIAAA
jgi:BirA family transcriptional regulator, biotin operon repressor / biotin---[acetyl-CoA-carboxylase] ligase